MIRLAVREVAEARGIKNAKQLGEAAGLHYKSAYAIWNGASKLIGLETIDKLCKTLRVHAGMLFEECPDIEDQPAVSKPSGRQRRGLR